MRQPSWSANAVRVGEEFVAARCVTNRMVILPNFTVVSLCAPPLLFCQFVLDVSNVFQLADSQFELATLLHNPALRSKPLLLILNKM